MTAQFSRNIKATLHKILASGGSRPESAEFGLLKSMHFTGNSESHYLQGNIGERTFSVPFKVPQLSEIAEETIALSPDINEWILKELRDLRIPQQTAAFKVQRFFEKLENIRNGMPDGIEKQKLSETIKNKSTRQKADTFLQEKVNEKLIRTDISSLVNISMFFLPLDKNGKALRKASALFIAVCFWADNLIDNQHSPFFKSHELTKLFNHVCYESFDTKKELNKILSELDLKDIEKEEYKNVHLFLESAHKNFQRAYEVFEGFTENLGLLKSTWREFQEASVLLAKLRSKSGVSNNFLGKILREYDVAFKVAVCLPLLYGKSTPMAILDHFPVGHLILLNIMGALTDFQNQVCSLHDDWINGDVDTNQLLQYILTTFDVSTLTESDLQKAVIKTTESYAEKLKVALDTSKLIQTEDSDLFLTVCWAAVHANLVWSKSSARYHSKAKEKRNEILCRLLGINLGGKSSSKFNTPSLSPAKALFPMSPLTLPKSSTQSGPTLPTSPICQFPSNDSGSSQGSQMTDSHPSSQSSQTSTDSNTSSQSSSPLAFSQSSTPLTDSSLSPFCRVPSNESSASSQESILSLSSQSLMSVRFKSINQPQQKKRRLMYEETLHG